MDIHESHDMLIGELDDCKKERDELKAKLKASQAEVERLRGIVKYCSEVFEAELYVLKHKPSEVGISSIIREQEKTLEKCKQALSTPVQSDGRYSCICAACGDTFFDDNKRNVNCGKCIRSDVAAKAAAFDEILLIHLEWEKQYNEAPEIGPNRNIIVGTAIQEAMYSMSSVIKKYKDEQEASDEQ